MPSRPSPTSLKSKCLTEVAKNLERLSYGCEKGSPELHDLIATEAFLAGILVVEEVPQLDILHGRRVWRVRRSAGAIKATRDRNVDIQR